MIGIAFVLGFFGSLHCLTMCGPLMVLFSFKSAKGGISMNAVVYHLSRVLGYGALGGLVGSVMQGLAMFVMGQNLSLLIGAILLLLGLLSVVSPRFRLLGGGSGVVSKLYAKTVGRLKGPSKFIVSGFLNALLPCGLVYVALAGAASSTDILSGTTYMLAFGLGTFPAMLGVSLFSEQLKSRMQVFKSRYLIPTFFLISGLLLLFRGLNLGIPYVSPKIIEESKVSCCHAK